MSAIRVGRLAGIPIGVQPLWFLILALITWSLGAIYFPEMVDGIAPVTAYLLGLVSALLLFVSILLHELGHSLEARRRGVEIEEIDLWILGGVARMRGYPDKPRDELAFALAGPAVTLVIALTFAVIAVLLPADTPDAVMAVISYQAFVNAAILVFNMLPAFPLDGGRVARSLIWMWTGDLRRATAAAVTVGRGFGFLLIGLGIVAFLSGAPTGLWFAVIGFFVTVAARAEEEGLKIRTAFKGREVGGFMSHPAVTIDASTTVDDAVESYFVRHRYTSFPVIQNGKAIGLIDYSTVSKVGRTERAVKSIGEVAIRDEDLVVGEHAEVTDLLQRPVFQSTGRAVVETDNGDVGIISVTDAQRALKAMELSDHA